MSSDLRLIDLMQMLEWKDIRDSHFMSRVRAGEIGGGGASSLEGYRIVFEKLRHIDPLPSEWRLTFDDDLSVSAEAPPGHPELAHLRSGEANRFALDGTPWIEFMGMMVSFEALDRFEWPDVAGACLWEMTFYGYSERQVDGFFAETETDYSWRHRLFISHAGEDKDLLVRPLAADLQTLGLRVWYDEYEIRWGDSVRRRLDEALARCDYGILVLSPSFFGKPWPEYELNAFVARALDLDRFILPIWYNVGRNEVLAFSPHLADRHALRTADFPDVSALALRIHEELFFDEQRPRAREREGG